MSPSGQPVRALSSARLLAFVLVVSVPAFARATPIEVRVVDQNGTQIAGSTVSVNGQSYATGTTPDIAPGTYTAYVSPGMGGFANPGGLTRAETVNLPTDGLRFTWITRAVTLDVRRNAADPASRLIGSHVRIINAPFAALDNVTNVASVWSSQAYPYGPGRAIPQTLTLPVTTGYANLSGNYAADGYDFVVLPSLVPGGIGALQRSEGQGYGTPSGHVTPTTSEFVFEWKTRMVTIDVRTDVTDPATRLVGSQVRIIGAAFAALDNVEGTPSVWSSQMYPYGPGLAVPQTIELPVTSGYLYTQGAYADEGYDLTVLPAVAPGQVGQLSRPEGQGFGTAPRQVEFTTNEWIIEWKTRTVTLDVRANAADPATRINGSIVRILGAAWAGSDNANGVPNVFSSQTYPYGAAPTIPTTVTLPLTRGYPLIQGAYATFGYDMSVEPGFLPNKPGTSGVLSRYDGLDATTPARHVEATTTELVFEWKTARVHVDVRTDAADPATSIAGSAVQFGAYQFGPVFIDNRDGIASTFTSQSYPYGLPVGTPFDLTLPVTTGYPYMQGSAATFGWDTYVMPGFCGRMQYRAYSGTRLSRTEGVDVATPPARHVTPTTTELIATWALDSNGVPVGADYAALVRDGVCNVAPVLAAIGPKSVNEGELLDFTLSASDQNPSDRLTYTVTTSPQPPDSTPTLDASTGRFTWTPGYSDTGSYTLTFSVSDGTLSDSETVTVTVANTDRAPGFDRQEARTIREGDLDKFSVDATDPDGTATTITLDASTAPDGFTFDPASKEAQWTPTYDQAGDYTLPFTATSNGLSTTLLLDITVTNRNRPPVFTSADTATARANEAFEFTLTATDPDGDTLQFGAKSMIETAQVDPTTGLVTWSPTYADPDQSWILQVNDGDGGIVYQTLTVTMEYPDRAPTIDPIAAITVPEGGEVAFTPVAADPDGDTLSFELEGLPEGADFNATSGRFAWIPTRRQAGSYPLVVRVLANGKSAQVAVDVTVTETNRAPVIDAPDTADAAPGTSFTTTFTVTDPDGQAVTCTVDSLPTGATYDDATRTVTWETPWDEGTSGYVLPITCTDGEDPATDGIAVRVSERLLTREGGGLASCLCSSGGGTAGLAGMLQFGLLLLSLRRRRVAGGGL